MSSNPFAPLNGGGGPKSAAKAAPPANFLSVMPVPKDAPALLKRHPTHGEPVHRWPYLDASGELLGYACRFVCEDGGKTYQPLTLFRETASGALKWKWKGWAEPRPLYGLDRLAARPEAPVLLCEGEKAADAAGDLVPDYVAVTSPNGSKSAGKADWSVLRGRRVVIWPDADAPGLAYASAAAALILAAGAASLARIEPPPGAIEGWDAADALAEGWAQDRALSLVAGARPIEPMAPHEELAPPRRQTQAEGQGSTRKRTLETKTVEGEKRKPGRPSWDSILTGLTSGYKLWHTPKNIAYASIPMPDGHQENWRITSSAFQLRLRLAAYEATGRIPPADAMKEITFLLEAQAITYGECHKEWRRVGERNGKLYLDLGCKSWRVVEISPDGQRIISNEDLPFIRPDVMQPLPEPIFGEENAINDLRRFVNVSTDSDFYLVVAWLLGALCAADEYPLLILNGEQGTGKSTMSRLLCTIVDPSSADLLGTPKEPRDLFVLAQHGHLAAFDNLSKVETWLSDCLCRIATGGTVAHRSMYTDEEISILSALRPVILNGIPVLSERPDLAQRSVTVRLKPVPPEERRTTADIRVDWEQALPRILGTLLEGLSRGLRDVRRTKLDRLPRMAQFAQFFVAAAPGCGLDGREMLDAYMTMQSDLADSAFDNDPVANAIMKMLDGTGGQWTGTPTELLAALSHPDVTPERVTNALTWPRKPQTLGNAIERIAPALRDRGIDVSKRHSGKTIYTINRARD